MAIDPATGATIPDAVTPAAGQTPITPITPYTPPQYSLGQQFQFDPTKALPQIQQQASAIYNPQVAQVQALAQLGAQQAETQKITTKEQFAKQLQSEIEAINARGAFFGGGALTRQSDIGVAQQRQLSALDLQQAAANAQTQGQLGSLAAQRAQYEQEQLAGRQGSAYQMYQDQQNMLMAERNYQQQVKESERNYALQLKQIKAQEKANKLSAKQAKKAKKEAKRQFDAELAYKYASLNKSSGGGKAEKRQAYIDAQGNVVELPSGYNYVGGLGQLNKNNEGPIF